MGIQLGAPVEDRKTEREPKRQGLKISREENSRKQELGGEKGKYVSGEPNWGTERKDNAEGDRGRRDKQD